MKHRITFFLLCFLASVFSLLASAPAAHAACTGPPSGNEGDIMYNANYCVLQYCNGASWIPAAKPQAPDCTGCGGGTPSVGTVCTDGSVYAGLSTDGNVPMYAQRCDIGQTWSGSCTGTQSTPCWNNCNFGGLTTTSMTNADTGKSNTATIVTFDADSGTAGTQPEQAAQDCVSLNEDGHTDWYLPAKNELNVLYLGKAAIGNFNSVSYWSSSEVSNSNAWTQDLGVGTQTSFSKYFNNPVRCVRR